jgi:hypothetical protein
MEHGRKLQASVVPEAHSVTMPHLNGGEQHDLLHLAPERILHDSIEFVHPQAAFHLQPCASARARVWALLTSTQGSGWWQG